MDKYRWFKEMPTGWKIYFTVMCYIGWFCIITDIIKYLSGK